MSSHRLIQLLILIALSIGLIYADRMSLFTKISAPFLELLTPLKKIGEQPKSWLNSAQIALQQKKQLHDENKALREELILSQAEIQRIKALTIENAQLRQLLGAPTQIGGRPKLIDTAGACLQTMRQCIRLKAGQRDGLFVGQPIFGPKSVLGQIIKITHYSSQAMLITDSDHAIPVVVKRNGFNAIASGTGKSDRLLLHNISAKADIVLNDILLSSGLGDHFPTGYPVARVTQMRPSQNQAFKTIFAEPLTKMRDIRFVLVSEEEKSTRAN